MATILAGRRPHRPFFAADALARWLDHAGLPLVMAAVLLTMVLAVA